MSKILKVQFLIPIILLSSSLLPSYGNLGHLSGIVPIIVLLLQTSQESGEGHPCPPHCHHQGHRCVCHHKDSEELTIPPYKQHTIPNEVILFLVHVRGSMTWLLSGAKSNTLAVCLECLQAILESNFQMKLLCVTFVGHDVPL